MAYVRVRANRARRGRGGGRGERHGAWSGMERRANATPRDAADLGAPADGGLNRPVDCDAMWTMYSI